MEYSEPEFLVRSRAAFLADPAPSLQHVRQQVAAAWSGTTRRDALSALDTLARVFNRDLSTIRTDPKTVRELLASKTALQLGLSEKRYANLRSSVVSSMRSFGGVPRAITGASRPGRNSWAGSRRLIYRMALHRLASFC